MKKFILEDDYLNLFPDTKIGILVCNGIDNHIKDEAKYAPLLRLAEKEAVKYVPQPEFIDNAIVANWREAFKKFKTKKGARCSIEALLKRVLRGDEIGCINPLVDIYNSISLKYGLPVGGEDIDKFDGDNRLTLAQGDEEFITYGSNESEPPYPGEVVYKDNYGAICRCYNWRESVRTALTEDTVNAFMCIETIEPLAAARLDGALDELKTLIEENLGGSVKKFVLDKDNKSIVIEE